MKTPVLLTFDMDAEALWQARDPESMHKPVWLSQGTYGPNTGLPRILRLLEKYDLPATFFVPGVVIENHPKATNSILEAGFAIEHHSHTHQWSDTLSPDQELEEFQRAHEVIVKATGRAPRGWRSPAGELTQNSISLMERFDIDFSSNLFGSDTAHLLHDGDRVTDIIELPFAWVLDDAPFFLYSNRLPGRTMSAPTAVAESWMREWDGISEEAGTHFMLAMHPQIIGRPSRLWALEQTILHILKSGRGEFLTCADYVDRVGPSLRAAEGGAI